MKKKLLICGATGFIGRNMVEYFSSLKNYDVIAVSNKRPAFDHPNVKWIKADLTNPQDVHEVVRGVDILIQAAATTSGSKDIVSRPFIHTTDNAVMNSLIFRAAHESEVKHILFFSCTVMLQSSDQALTEDNFDANTPIHPRYFGVGWTKVYLEKMCEFYAGLGKTKYTAIRHSNIYGPHDKYDLERSHVFGATVTKVMTAKDKITVWGSGEEARDLLYVGDLTGFVHKAIDNQKDHYELFNCGAGNAVRIKDLVLKMVEKSGKKLSIDHDLSQPSIPTSLFLDCSKAKKILGWSPAIQLEEGIEKTLKWYRSNFNV
jgi:nucleoside-diphosphate-sugar epimerase